ncbi:hypothetical protein, unlikely [Trypanosoma brucei gambiense DAL972]|uniref:Uncharacterized protein n=1 Tax=Trypanosoma brucei gambiense (strain MHOM/CI/86/DAL972) TaxID=679716 RepID=C9ZV27_TRYB9|nr:hypothetical protein, unlikely [Trypanosoma brucei gambiense DAL972]CBH13265.1 hypothetical protein, unlikely [Trypanosoma brucei gambiense DAL972]|eukprot:XP_011775542.1 hypothetical protein, unlikely [Trypanosoma brucei gambiense DAL972]
MRTCLHELSFYSLFSCRFELILCVYNGCVCVYIYIYIYNYLSTYKNVQQDFASHYLWSRLQAHAYACGQKGEESGGIRKNRRDVYQQKVIVYHSQITIIITESKKKKKLCPHV